MSVEERVRLDADSSAPSEGVAPKASRWVYIGAIIMGWGILYPYNCMISSYFWYEHVWPGEEVIFWAPLLCTLTSPIVQYLLLFFQPKAKSFKPRIVSGFLAYALLTCLLSLLPVFFGSRPTNSLSKILRFIIMFLVGAVNAFLSNAVFSFASALGPDYAQGVMAGNGWSGVIASCVRLVVDAFVPIKDNNDTYTNTLSLLSSPGFMTSSTSLSASADTLASINGLAYFISASGVSLLCAFTFALLNTSPFVRHQLTQASAASNDDNEKHNKEQQSDETTSLLLDSHPNPDTLTINQSNTQLLLSSSKSDDDFDDDAPISFKSIISTFKIVKLQAISLLLVFILTFLVFPAVVNALASTISNLGDNTYHTLLIIQFNLFDLFGRSLPAYKLIVGPTGLIFAVMSRFVFYPIFIIIKQNYFYNYSSIVVFIVMGLFALSNGYLSTLGFIYGPGHPGLKSNKQRGLAGGILSMILVLGICLGSLIALLVKKVLHWPGDL